MKERKEKYFAYISIADLTHDDFNTAGYLDEPTHKLMTKLFEENLVEDTVIFFFSDHGIRLGAITSTHSGSIEARLPFMFIHLPKGYMNEYRDILSVNQYRLTTPFDIHSTLLHILDGNNFFIFFD
jgi:phosphoglycerol transferase MdoB-like AlkP superfamily enzyme